MSGRVHHQPIRIDFAHADMAGIVYFPRLFHFCHVAMEGLVEAAMDMSYARFVSERNLGFPTAHTEADYHRPMSYGRHLDLAMTIRRLGTKSVDFRWTVTLDGDDMPCAEVRSTTVCVNMREFESRPLPDDVRTAFEPYVEA
ncbi:MAG: hypothetical protein CMJ83_21040 [Planctomycetes bacterium]|nr:hypothetical protein [Planctomycetota bacterium]